MFGYTDRAISILRGSFLRNSERTKRQAYRSGKKRPPGNRRAPSIPSPWLTSDVGGGATASSLGSPQEASRSDLFIVVLGPCCVGGFASR